MLGLKISGFSRIVFEMVKFDSTIFEIFDQFPGSFLDNAPWGCPPCIRSSPKIAWKVLIDGGSSQLASLKHGQQAFAVENLARFWSFGNFQQRGKQVDVDRRHVG